MMCINIKLLVGYILIANLFFGITFIFYIWKERKGWSARIIYERDNTEKWMERMNRKSIESIEREKNWYKTCRKKDSDMAVKICDKQ